MEKKLTPTLIEIQHALIKLKKQLEEKQEELNQIATIIYNDISVSNVGVHIKFDNQSYILIQYKDGNYELKPLYEYQSKI